MDKLAPTDGPFKKDPFMTSGASLGNYKWSDTITGGTVPFAAYPLPAGMTSLSGRPYNVYYYGCTPCTYFNASNKERA
jgi:hypothetical protein